VDGRLIAIIAVCSVVGALAGTALCWLGFRQARSASEAVLPVVAPPSPGCVPAFAARQTRGALVLAAAHVEDGVYPPSPPSPPPKRGSR